MIRNHSIRKNAKIKDWFGCGLNPTFIVYLKFWNPNLSFLIKVQRINYSQAWQILQIFPTPIQHCKRTFIYVKSYVKSHLKKKLKYLNGDTKMYSSVIKEYLITHPTFFYCVLVCYFYQLCILLSWNYFALTAVGGLGSNVTNLTYYSLVPV